ncbi:MAG TPA: hypothetical protein VLF43_05165, partial [Candidatus Saccharimonadales bacterium]|nr:hypothetical protein [Candidatus Saccharimonadales bacterium]
TQLCPEVIAETGGRNGYRITHDSLWQRGIRGLIIPSHHLLRSHMDDAAYRLPWRDTLQAVEEVGAQVHGVHVEAGRVDTRHEPDKQRSLSELLAILTGPNAIAQTDMGKVLTEAVGIWRRQRSGLFISWARLKRLHAQQGGVAVQHQNSSAIDKLHAYAGDSKITQARNENMYSMTLHDLYPKLPVSVEIPYNGLLAVRGVRRLSRADFAAVHRDIITSLHEFFAGLPR